MLRSIFVTVVSVSIALHAMLGCCGHHAHEVEAHDHSTHDHSTHDHSTHDHSTHDHPASDESQPGDDGDHHDCDQHDCSASVSTTPPEASNAAHPYWLTELSINGLSLSAAATTIAREALSTTPDTPPPVPLYLRMQVLRI